MEGVEERLPLATAETAGSPVWDYQERGDRVAGEELSAPPVEPAETVICASIFFRRTSRESDWIVIVALAL